MPNDDLVRRIEELERQMRDHHHSGLDGTRVNLFDVLGKIEVVSAAPVGKPIDLSAQFKIYTNGSTYRFYWYDTTAGVWHYVTATA